MYIFYSIISVISVISVIFIGFYSVLIYNRFLKSRQHRLHILLKDINQNRYRLADAEGDEHLSFTLKQLALEELLSEEQHLELDKALLEDELDSSRIVDIIKGWAGTQVSSTKIKRSGEEITGFVRRAR